MKCPKKTLKGGWREVVSLLDLDEDTLQCPCKRDYSTQCVCPDPSNPAYEYKLAGSTLFGRKVPAS